MFFGTPRTKSVGGRSAHDRALEKPRSNRGSRQNSASSLMKPNRRRKKPGPHTSFETAASRRSLRRETGQAARSMSARASSCRGFARTLSAPRQFNENPNGCARHTTENTAQQLGSRRALFQIKEQWRQPAKSPDKKTSFFSGFRAHRSANSSTTAPQNDTEDNRSPNHRQRFTRIPWRGRLAIYHGN